MPSPPPSVFLPRNGGSDSIRSTVSLGIAATFKKGTVLSVGNDGKIRPYSCHNSEDFILGIAQELRPPMNTEVDVVLSGIVLLDWIKSGKTYYLQNDGTIGEHGDTIILQGILDGQGLFVRPDKTVSAQLPTGTIAQFCGTTPPLGWLLCDGSLISQTEYPRLQEILAQTPKPLTLKTISVSDNFAVFAYRGRIQTGKFLFMSTLGWKGKVEVMSTSQNALTVYSAGEFPVLSKTAGNPCNFLPIDPHDSFLPIIEDMGYGCIVKT